MTNLPRKEAKRLRKERDTRPPRRGDIKSLGSHSHNRFLFSFLPRFPYCPCDRLRFFVFLPLAIALGVSMFLPRSSPSSLSPSTASFSWCTAAAAYVGVAIHHNRRRRTPSSEKRHSRPGVGCGGGISCGTSSFPSYPPSSSRLFSSSTSSTTWEDGYIEVFRPPPPWSVEKLLKGLSKSRRYRIYYRIANPELLLVPPSSSSSDDDASMDGIEDAERTDTAGPDESGPAPLLVIHGGPSLPSDYLLPLADALNIQGDDHKHATTRRSVVFYDQLGCGGSSEPRDVGAYSVEYAVDDMEVVIAELLGGGGGGAEEAGGSLGCGGGFHLYGHSFGGMLAHRYLCRIAERQRGGLGCDDDDEVAGATTPTCLSVVLSSTPTSIDESESSMNSVTERLLGQDPDLTTLNERFRRTCQCRTPDVPRPLADAFDRAGTVWAGTDAVVGFECSPPVVGSARMPPALIVGGEHDFVNPTGRRGDSPSAGRWWTTTTSGSGYGCEDGGMLFNHDDVRVEVLGDCSHFCLLEDEALYGRVVESFLEEHDT